MQISFLLPYVSDVGNDASGVRGSLDNSIKGDIMTIIVDSMTAPVTCTAKVGSDTNLV